MAEPDFIVPPPGLIPPAPEQPAQPERTDPDRTVRAVPARVLPSFAPPTGPVAPRAPLPPLPPGPPCGAAPVVPPVRVEAPTPTPQQGAWRLRTADGLEVLLLRPVVLGRDPVADAGRPGAATIRLVDPARSVSKTHALVEVVDDRVTVTDLHSTNGSRVLTPGGDMVELDPGLAAAVVGGSTILLGEFAVTLDRAPLNSV